MSIHPYLPQAQADACSAGVVFDLLQCLVQRALLYATQDVRDCYVLVKKALKNEKKKKVILILHSQGGIEGGMIIDWLLDELPFDELQKLEVYTFGCLANHFSNPVRAKDPDSSASVEVLSHIEHYANKNDFACRFGVLHYTDRKKEKEYANRFNGLVLVNPVGGHQLNQHYLDLMFPLDENLERAREPEPDDFMNLEARLESRGDDGRIERVTRDDLFKELNMECEPAVNGLGNKVPRMKDVSRLWQYRNGGSPI